MLTTQLLVVSPPISTDYTIVIPYEFFKGRFSKTVYTPEMTENRASNEEINQVLAKVEDILSSKPSYAKTFFSLLMIYIIAGIIAFLLQKPFNYTFQYWFEGSFFLFLGVVFFAFLFIYANQVKKRKAEVNDYIDSIQYGFKQRGLRWHLPQQFPQWIEIFKDYRAVSNLDA